jgi:hypothetical protein
MAPRTRTRQTVTFTKPQLAFLRAEAERLGITVADLIRRIIDAYREGRWPMEDIDRKTAIAVSEGHSAVDPDAVEKVATTDIEPVKRRVAVVLTLEERAASINRH